MRRLFPNAGADEKPGFFLLGLIHRYGQNLYKLQSNFVQTSVRSAS